MLMALHESHDRSDENLLETNFEDLSKNFQRSQIVLSNTRHMIEEAEMEEDPVEEERKGNKFAPSKDFTLKTDFYPKQQKSMLYANRNKTMY